MTVTGIALPCLLPCFYCSHSACRRWLWDYVRLRHVGNQCDLACFSPRPNACMRYVTKAILFVVSLGVILEPKQHPKQHRLMDHNAQCDAFMHYGAHCMQPYVGGLQTGEMVGCRLYYCTILQGVCMCAGAVCDVRCVLRNSATMKILTCVCVCTCVCVLGLCVQVLRVSQGPGCYVEALS
jgi:hypothetical protein